MRWKSQGSTLRTKNEHHLLCLLPPSFISGSCKVEQKRTMSYFELFTPEVDQLCSALLGPPFMSRNLKALDFFTVSDMKSEFSLFRSRVWSPRGWWERTAWCVGSKSPWFTGSKLLAFLFLKMGQGWDKWLSGLLPTAYCYPARGGSHCCASSLSLTTSVNRDLNNKQKACKSVCVTVSFSGLCF